MNNNVINFKIIYMKDILKSLSKQWDLELSNKNMQTNSNEFYLFRIFNYYLSLTEDTTDKNNHPYCVFYLFNNQIYYRNAENKIDCQFTIQEFENLLNHYFKEEYQNHCLKNNLLDIYCFLNNETAHKCFLDFIYSYINDCINNENLNYYEYKNVDKEILPIYIQSIIKE